jgi:hypothetical protein
MNKASLKELIEGIKNIQCLRILDLSFCHLSDELEEEIAEIFSIEKLEFINLKSNFLSKKVAITIGKKLKEFKNHIGYLEYCIEIGFQITILAKTWQPLPNPSKSKRIFTILVYHSSNMEIKLV